MDKNQSLIDLEPNYRKSLVKTLTDMSFFTDLKESDLLSKNGQHAQWLFDFRPVLLDGKILKDLVDIFWDEYKDYDQLQIAAIELAGVPLLSGILYEGAQLGKIVNGLIIRKSAKKYGRSLKIEGNPKKGIKTIFVDDLINSGNTVEKAKVQLSEIGIILDECFSILTFQSASFDLLKKKYGICSKHIVNLSDFPISKENNFSQNQKPLRRFETIWCFDPQLPWNKFMVFCKSSPVISDEIVYWGTDANVFFANDIKTGHQIWKKEGSQLNFLKGIWSTPDFDDQNVFYGSYDGGLRAINKKNGYLSWESMHADFIGSSPVCYSEQNKIFVGLEYAKSSFQGGIACFNTQNGDLNWQYQTKSFVHSSPVVSKKNSLVVCGTNDNDLYAFNIDSGSVKWRVQLFGTVKMSPTLDSDEKYLYAASTDGLIYKIETTTGNIAYKYKTNNSNLAQPLWTEKHLIVASCDNSIYVFDHQNNQLIKKIPTAGRLMAQPKVLDGSIFLANNTGLVMEIDMLNYDIIGTYQLPDRVNNAIAFCKKNNIFVAHTGDDRIFAFQRT